MDDDESGLISYVESDMVRGQLQMTARMLPEKTLKTVWKALDADSSGRLTAGEFGAFSASASDRAAVSDKARSGAPDEMHNRQVDAEKVEMDGAVARRKSRPTSRRHRGGGGLLSEMLNVKMHQPSRSTGVPTKNWYRLFKHMDDAPG